MRTATLFRNTGAMAAALVLGIFSAPPCLGVTVTVDGDEVVFSSGGFEVESSGMLPGAATGSPTVGFYETENTRGVCVGSGDSGDPDGPKGAAVGTNYLMLDRTASGANAKSWITMQFKRDVDPDKESFDIRLQLWGTPLGATGDMFSMSIGDDTADGTASKVKNILTAFGYNASLDVPAFVSYTNAGSKTISPSLDSAWKVGAWNDVIYTWDAKAQKASLNVNGTVSQLINQLDDPDIVNQLHIRPASSSSQIYIDGDSGLVPTPTGDGH